MSSAPPPPGGSTVPPPPGHETGPDSRSFWVRHSTGLIATAIVVVGIAGSFIYFTVTSPN